MNSADPQESFIDSFFDAVSPVFFSYGVKQHDIQMVREEVKKEVIGNSEYKYERKEIPHLNISDILNGK